MAESAILTQMLALANEEAETGIDMNEAVKGGGGARLLPEGYAFGRLCEYVEYGNQPQEYQGKPKDPALEFHIGFALTGEGYQNDDGTPYVMRTFSMAQSRNEKARAFLLFKSLNWKGDKKNFAQMLGGAYLVKITNVPKSKTDATLVSRMDLKGFLPPLDPVSKQPYPIAEVRAEDLCLFLWNRPTQTGWDTLFIDGKRDDGTSKNFIQEKIMCATDFAGSPLELMLQGAGGLPAAPAAASTPGAPATPPATPAVPAMGTPEPEPAAATPAMPAMPTMPAMPGA